MKNSRIITNTFKYSPYICSAKFNTAIAVPSSTRIDAQYEIGLFLCPSVNHIVVILEMVPYTKFVDVAICDKCIRLSFPTFFALRNRTVLSLATSGNGSRSCIRLVQENLPKIAKLNTV